VDERLDSDGRGECRSGRHEKWGSESAVAQYEEEREWLRRCGIELIGFECLRGFLPRKGARGASPRFYCKGMARGMGTGMGT
jgi:hypothetical protein